MKLYSSLTAPNPRRVTLYLREKGLELPTHWVDLGAGEQFAPAYATLNPDRVVPTLVLDDGTSIGESLAICRSLETMYPDPPMFGRDPREVGLVEQWNRRVEIQGYFPTQDAYRNSRPGFAGRALPGTKGDVPQLPELVNRSSTTMRRLLGTLDDNLADRPFLGGDGFTMADILLYTTLEFGLHTGFEPVMSLGRWPRVAAWFERVGARPSTAPSDSAGD